MNFLDDNFLFAIFIFIILMTRWILINLKNLKLDKELKKTDHLSPEESVEYKKNLLIKYGFGERDIEKSLNEHDIRVEERKYANVFISGLSFGLICALSGYFSKKLAQTSIEFWTYTIIGIVSFILAIIMLFYRAIKMSIFTIDTHIKKDKEINNSKNLSEDQ